MKKIITIILIFLFYQLTFCQENKDMNNKNEKKIENIKKDKKDKKENIYFKKLKKTKYYDIIKVNKHHKKSLA